MLAKLAYLPLLAALLSTGQAHAHARWLADSLTPPRTNADDIKVGPCGAARTDNPAVLVAGSTVTLEFESTIHHQGDFRIAFSEANDEGFDQHILAEGIPDHDGVRFPTAEVTLPDVECDQCTLQLIQVMRDRTPPTNYYSCADIQLTRADGADVTAPGAVTGLVAVPGDKAAVLSWSNPADADFAGVLLLQDELAVTATPEDGQMYAADDTVDDAKVIYRGSAEGTTASDLTAGATTHFAVYSYDDNFNYSDGVSTSVDLPEQVPNFAPTVLLEWDQESHSTGQVDTSTSGLVTVTAEVSDSNASDSHTYAWSSSYPGLQDLDGDDAAFTFDPQGLESGMYEIALTVTDNGAPAMSATASVFLEFAAQPNGGGGAAGFWWLILLALAPLWRRFGLKRL